MARRAQIGGDDGDYAAFLASRQQQADPRMAMALQIMGLMDKQQSEQQRQALDERQQAWLEKNQAGQLGIEQLKQKAAETEYQSLAEARKAATASEAQKRIDEAAKEAATEKQQAANLDYLKTKADRDAAVEVFKNAVEHGNLKEGTPQYEILAEAAMPGYKEKSTAAKKGIFEENVAAGLAKYQKATPKEREAYAKTPGAFGTATGLPQDIYDEVLKRANMQVAQPGAPAAASPGEGRLPLSRFAEQNVPTAPSSDIFSETGVRIGPPLVDARDYSKFPGSVEDLIRASSGQPLPELQFVQPRQPVANAPAPAPSNFYEEGYPSAKPDYMYGIQTPVAADVINKYANDPRFTPVEDELMAKLKGWWNQPKAPVASGLPFPPQGVLQPNPGY